MLVKIEFPVKCQTRKGAMVLDSQTCYTANSVGERGLSCVNHAKHNPEMENIVEHAFCLAVFPPSQFIHIWTLDEHRHLFYKGARIQCV